MHTEQRSGAGSVSYHCQGRCLNRERMPVRSSNHIMTLSLLENESSVTIDRVPGSWFTLSERFCQNPSLPVADCSTSNKTIEGGSIRFIEPIGKPSPVVDGYACRLVRMYCCVRRPMIVSITMMK